MPQLYYKMIVSGRVVEILSYERKFLNQHIASPRRQDGHFNQISSHVNKLKHSRAIFLRILYANEHFFSSFITLTFSDNVSDITYAFQKLKQWVRKIRNKYAEFQYAGVFERQGRGSIHFHLLSNVSADLLASLSQKWVEGWMYCSSIYDFEPLCLYLGKSLASPIDSSFKYKKKFFYSRNLYKPFVSQNQSDIFFFLSKENTNLVFQNEFHNLFSGTIMYRKFIKN